MAFVECFMNEEYAACPPTSWKNSQECNDIKESIVKCNRNAENVIMSYLSRIPKPKQFSFKLRCKKLQFYRQHLVQINFLLFVSRRFNNNDFKNY